MGTKGASGITKNLFGSKTTDVIKRSEVPVLVIPKDASYHKFNEIIYAIDYMSDNTDSIAKVVSETTKFKMPIKTVHIAQKKNFYEELMHDNFKRFVTDNFQGVYSACDIIYNKPLLDGLHAYMNNNKNALLVLTPHSKNYLKTIRNLSLSQEMGFQSSTPLLIINDI